VLGADDREHYVTSGGCLVPSSEEILEQDDQRIRVVVRKRPINSREESRGERDVVTADAWCQVSIHEPKTKVDLTRYTDVHTYRFDQVFNEFSSNEEVYAFTAKPLIQHLFAGGRSTCFAYGQTGSGKTFTMMEKDTGLYVLAAQDIFSELRTPARAQQGLTAHFAFFEIYGGKLFDLLNQRRRLWAREDAKGNVCIADLQVNPIADVESLLAAIEFGLASRSTGATGVNADSSRSHAILQIFIKTPRGRTHGKISFIDLAGSERAADTMNSDRQTRMEGAEINKSLLALKECIRALDRDATHTPFRGSKLTMVLKDSFVGDAKTVMIANVSPNTRSCENTLNTLRYADRVKELQSRAPAGRKSSASSYPVLRPGHTIAEAATAARERAEERARERDLRDQAAARPVRRISSRPAAPHPAEPIVVRAALPDAPTPARGPSPAPDALAQTHEALITSLYVLEEEMMAAHRREVDDMMSLVKEEVALLHAIEQAELPLDDWIDRLDSILARKVHSIGALQSKIGEFRQSLDQEAQLIATRTSEA
jgi:kinesin family protein 2/24